MVINHIMTFPKTGFTKREFVVKTDEKYPQLIKFEMTKENCALLDSFKAGDLARISFNLRGSEWQGKVFTNLQAWRIDRLGDSMPVAWGVPEQQNQFTGGGYQGPPPNAPAAMPYPGNVGNAYPAPAGYQQYPAANQYPPPYGQAPAAYPSNGAYGNAPAGAYGQPYGAPNGAGTGAYPSNGYGNAPAAAYVQPNAPANGAGGYQAAPAPAVQAGWQSQQSQPAAEQAVESGRFGWDEDEVPL